MAKQNRRQMKEMLIEIAGLTKDKTGDGFLSRMQMIELHTAFSYLQNKNKELISLLIRSEEALKKTVTIT